MPPGSVPSSSFLAAPALLGRERRGGRRSHHHGPGGFEDFMREWHEAEGDAWDAVAAWY
jgi:hypothetical protein